MLPGSSLCDAKLWFLGGISVGLGLNQYKIAMWPILKKKKRKSHHTFVLASYFTTLFYKVRVFKTLFRFIIVVCGINNILRIAKYCRSHKTLLWIWIMLCSYIIRLTLKCGCSMECKSLQDAMIILLGFRGPPNWRYGLTNCHPHFLSRRSNFEIYASL